MKKHKANYTKKYEATYFGQFYYETTPMCDGKFPWNGKIYIQVRNWKNVTCKKCLSKKPIVIYLDNLTHKESKD